jgi:hypothetical protein
VLAEVVNVTELWQTVAAAFIAGVGVTFAFALAILGTARFVDLRGEDRPAAAVAFAVLAVVAFVAVIGAIIFGTIVMTAK